MGKLSFSSNLQRLLSGIENYVPSAAHQMIELFLFPFRKIQDNFSFLVFTTIAQSYLALHFKYSFISCTLHYIRTNVDEQKTALTRRKYFIGSVHKWTSQIRKGSTFAHYSRKETNNDSEYIMEVPSINFTKY